jgi:DNA-binding SARP family transcriptional activator
MFIQLVGRPAILCADGKSVPLSAKDAALLVMVALDASLPVSRAKEWIWPGFDDPGHNLSTRRSWLKSKAGNEVIVSKQSSLVLAANISVDCLAADIGHLDGDLLGEVDYSKISEQLGAWVDARRQWFRDLRGSELGRLGQQLVDQGDSAAALQVAHRLLAHEPVNESGYRLAMHAHFLGGDRASALGCYNRLVAVLRKEFATGPDKRTVELMRTIVSIEGAPSNNQRWSVPLTLRRPPRLIGRTEQLHRMWSACENERHVVLVGEAGVGKSRLVETFATGDGSWTSCRANAGDDRFPYQFLSRLLSNLLASGENLQHISAKDRSVLARIGVQVAGAEHSTEDLSKALVRDAAIATLSAVDPTRPRRLCERPAAPP